MKISLKKELPIIAIVLLPFIYLFFIWNSLPDEVPLHWNLEGEIDRWGSKNELLIIPFLLPVLIYVLMLIVPYIDPKKRIAQMGGKYYQLKFIMVLFMSGLALFILYFTKNQSILNPHMLFIIIGLLFAVLGNYMQSVKPNYFIGIRTPWTLENETVWKKTHKLGGIFFLVGGICIVMLSFIIDDNARLFMILFMTIVGIISIIPVLYSFLIYKKLDKAVHENG